jgi:hypothetical protein
MLVIILILTGCKSGEKDKLPDGNQPPTPIVYSPLPPFHEIFRILDYLKLGDYDQAIDEKIFTTRQETGQAAFALGVLTADGIISVRGHNKTKLNAIAEEMIKISNFLGLDNSILRLADQLKELISNDNWVELEKALEYYKTEVEGTLYQSQQYDQFTMMQMGGWVEGINRISWFVNRNYQFEKSKVLMQKGTLNHLISNLGYINTPSIRDSYYLRASKDKLSEVKSIIDNSQQGGYTKQQVEKLITITDEIKKVYNK